MKRFFSSALAIAILTVPFSATSADIMVISGGSPGGNYNRWGVNLSRMLQQSARIKAEVVQSGGSKDNIACIEDGTCHVSFTQVDALKSMGAGGADILGDMGQECVFVAVHKDGKIGDEDDLQKEGNGARIAVGSAGSGAQISWSYMQQLEDGYKATSAVYTGGARALAKLKAKQVDAVMFVTSPENLGHKLIAGVLANKDLEFIDIDDSDLNDELPDGTPVYVFEDVTVKPGLFATKVETICTGVVAIGSPNLTDRAAEAVANLFLSNAEAIKQ